MSEGKQTTPYNEQLAPLKPIRPQHGRQQAGPAPTAGDDAVHGMTLKRKRYRAAPLLY